MKYAKEEREGEITSKRSSERERGRAKKKHWIKRSKVEESKKARHRKRKSSVDSSNFILYET